MTLIANIIGEVVTQMEALTPATDAGSPGQFTSSPFLSLQECSIDRSFVVRPTGSNDRNTTGTSSGVIQRVFEFQVIVKHINEGRTWAEAAEIWADDMVRIQDFLQVKLRLLAGVDECTTHNGDATADWDSEPGTIYTTIPFRVEYTDTMVTA